MIAERKHGIMILLKRNYLINMIDQQRNSDVKLVLCFFNLKDGVIHATDKTEIKVDDKVTINYIYIYIYINHTYYTLLINYYLLNNNNSIQGHS